MGRCAALRGRPVAVVALCTLLLAGACTGASRDGASESRGPEGSISVTRFGARGDGKTDDSRAFQSAIDSLPASGGTVFVPAGTYRMGSAVIIRKNGVAIEGHGPASVMRLADGVRDTMFVMPAPFGTNTTDLFVADVRISKLTLDGNKNGSPQEAPTFFGVQIRHAQRVLLSELTMRDWPYDAISIGVGEKPNVDITVRDSRFTGVGRNAIHLGYGSNLRISRVFIQDTPSQQWGPAAGNAIDIEVEGENSFVDGFRIEDSIFERMGTRTAGYGIALQPAFGPIRNGLIRGNLIRNHQHGVFVGTAQGITVEDNWVIADNNQTTGAGITVFDGTAKVQNNVLNLLRWPSVFDHAGVLIHRPTTPLAVTGNRVWGGECTLRVQEASHPVAVASNLWGNESGCFVEGSSSPIRVEQSDNERRQLTTLDEVPPTVGLQSSKGKVSAVVEDQGEGVGRVFFLVDGLPAEVVDRAPYEIVVDEDRFGDGEHVVEALAVDKAANVSEIGSIKVRVAS